MPYKELNMQTIEWIPCSERLPCEQDGTILISLPNGTVTTARYSEFSKRWYKGDMCGVGGEDPEAWMPMIKSFKNECHPVIVCPYCGKRIK